LAEGRFVCECTKLDCTELLPLTMAAYEAVRATPTHFIFAPDRRTSSLTWRGSLSARSTTGCSKRSVPLPNEPKSSATRSERRSHAQAHVFTLKPHPSRAAAAGSLARRG